MTSKVLEAMAKTEEVAQANLSMGAKLALVKNPKEEGERVILNIESLPSELQPRVQKYYHDLGAALHDFGRAGLKVGQILKEARDLLKPLGVWLAFLNRIPGLSAKTGDRFIKRFEMAQRQLSETLISLSITTGIQLAGETEKEPYGKYTKAVTKVGSPPKDTGERDKDLEKARVWLGKVLVVYNKQLKAARARAKVDPVDRAANFLLRQTRGYVEDKEGQVEFLKRVLQKTLTELGYKEMLVMRGSPATPIRRGEKVSA